MRRILEANARSTKAEKMTWRSVGDRLPLVDGLFNVHPNEKDMLQHVVRYSNNVKKSYVSVLYMALERRCCKIYTDFVVGDDCFYKSCVSLEHHLESSTMFRMPGESQTRPNRRKETGTILHVIKKIKKSDGQ